VRAINLRPDGELLYAIVLVFCAKGAVFILAWENAPGICVMPIPSAESAIHFDALSRALSGLARYLGNASVGRVTHSRSPDVGGILDCGGKRSATPLCLAQLRGNRESLRKKRRRRFALPAQSKMLAQ